MNLVTILPQGSKFCLRTGIFHTFVGWQTAEAAKLDVKTRTPDGKPITHCLDGLTAKDAARLGSKLEAWLKKLEEPAKAQRKDRMLERVGEKYREVMRE